MSVYSAYKAQACFAACDDSIAHHDDDDRDGRYTTHARSIRVRRLRDTGCGIKSRTRFPLVLDLPANQRNHVAYLDAALHREVGGGDCTALASNPHIIILSYNQFLL